MTWLRRLVFSGLILSGPVWGSHWHENPDDWKWHWEHELDDEAVNHHHGKGCYFEPHDLRLINTYYLQLRRASRVAEKSVAGEKKIHRNGELPRGWETRMELLPALVECLLVPVPAGYRRGIIDGFAVVYNLQTGEILDAAAITVN